MGDELVTCPQCKGAKQLDAIGCRGPKGCHAVRVDCPWCDGRGSVTPAQLEELEREKAAYDERRRVFGG